MTSSLLRQVREGERQQVRTSLLRILLQSRGRVGSERLEEAERGFKRKDVTRVYVPRGMVQESEAEAEFRKKLLKWRRRIGHGALRTVVNSGET